MRSLLLLPLLTGCMGVYAEVATTTLPSATVDGTTTTGASSIGFNIGAEFSSARMRFALGYAKDSTSFEGGSADLGTSSNRFDFNVFSISDRARVRLGLGFARGDGSATAGGTTESGGGGSAFAGIDFTYFLTWKIAAHAFAGPTYFSQSIPGGSVSGSGATARLAVSYTFGDIRPDTTVFMPLEDNKDLTGILEAGAESMGCSARRDSHPSSGYAMLRVKCSGREVFYYQVAEGIMALCNSMFKKECNAFTSRLIAGTVANMKASQDSAVPTPPAPKAPVAPPPAPVTPPAPVAPAVSTVPAGDPAAPAAPAQGSAAPAPPSP